MWLGCRTSRATAELDLGGPTRGRGRDHARHARHVASPSPPIHPSHRLAMSTVLKLTAAAVRILFFHDRNPHLILRLFSKTRLSARSCTRAYATTSAPRRGIPPSPTSLFFFPSLLTSFAADLIQDLYLKELKLYKAPPAVSRPRMYV